MGCCWFFQSLDCVTIMSAVVENGRLKVIETYGMLVGRLRVYIPSHWLSMQFLFFEML